MNVSSNRVKGVTELFQELSNTFLGLQLAILVFEVQSITGKQIHFGKSGPFLTSGNINIYRKRKMTSIYLIGSFRTIGYFPDGATMSVS